MKKKIVAMMLAVSMSLTFAACGKSEKNNSNTEQVERMKQKKMLKV